MALPTLDQLDEAFERMLQQKTEINRQAALAATNDTVSRITERVQQKGLNKDLQSFSPYSQAYFDFREEKGRNKFGTFKNFTFIGDTINSVQSIEVSVGPERAIIAIDSIFQANRDIIRYNSERENTEILAPTAQEIQKAGQTYVNEVVRRLERVLVQ